MRCPSAVVQWTLLSESGASCRKAWLGVESTTLRPLSHESNDLSVDNIKWYCLLVEAVIQMRVPGNVVVLFAEMSHWCIWYTVANVHQRCKISHISERICSAVKCWWIRKPSNPCLPCSNTTYIYYPVLGKSWTKLDRSGISIKRWGFQWIINSS